MNVRTAMNSASIAGISLWQFMCIKVNQVNATYPGIRPGGLKNKGILDRWFGLKAATREVANAFADVEYTVVF